MYLVTYTIDGKTYESEVEDYEGALTLKDIVEEQGAADVTVGGDYGPTRESVARWYQELNGNAICPSCGAVGRTNKLCVPCEAKG